MKSPELPIGLVINPVAGRNRGKRAGQAIVRELTKQGVPHVVIIGASTEDCIQQVTTASPNVRGFLLVGGDGLVFSLLQHKEFRTKPFSVFPAGSGNDFARTMGFSRRVQKNVRNLLNSIHAPQRIDAGYALVGTDRDPKWFVGHISLGFVSRVNERANNVRLPLGSFGYIYALLVELLVDRIDTFSVTMSGTTAQRKALVMVVMNLPMLGGGIRLAPAASAVDGKLNLVEVAPASRRRLFSVLPRLATARHEGLPEVEISTVKEILLDGADMLAYADGDYVGTAPVHVQSKPRELLVWKPIPE